jgi:hypothetical protein
MKSEELLKKYVEVKEKKYKENIPMTEKQAYLSGWLDCACCIIDGEKND